MQARQATVTMSPQQRETIPRINPVLAVFFWSPPDFIPRAPKTIARIPQTDPTQPNPAALPPMAITREIIPKTNAAVGITFSIVFQAFMNMSVASSFLPTTGVPLPFISYGGSSVLFLMMEMGMVFRVARDNNA